MEVEDEENSEVESLEKKIKKTERKRKKGFH